MCMYIMSIDAISLAKFTLWNGTHVKCNVCKQAIFMLLNLETVSILSIWEFSSQATVGYMEWWNACQLRLECSFVCSWQRL